MNQRVLAPALAAFMITFGSQADEPEPSPEVKAIVKLQTTTLRTSKSATERKKAAEVLGALGKSGQLARRDLCQSMMDSSRNVRIAAADALKAIDESTYKLATAIYINVDQLALQKAATLGLAAEPLTPLLLRLAENSSKTALSAATAYASTGKSYSQAASVVAYNVRLLEGCMAALAAAAPRDPHANKLIIHSLSFQLPNHRSRPTYFDSESQRVRAAALVSLRSLANIKQALKPLQKVATSDVAKNRIAAIGLLASIHDADNGAAVRKTLEGVRFDNDETIRLAVEQALKKIDAKKP